VAFPPEGHFTGTTDVDWEGKNPDDRITLYYIYADEHFLDLLDLEMVERIQSSYEAFHWG
jgi:hypothetical protein